MSKTKQARDSAYVIGDDFMTNPTIDTLDILCDMQNEVSFYSEAVYGFSENEGTIKRSESLSYMGSKLFELSSNIGKLISSIEAITLNKDKKSNIDTMQVAPCNE